MDNRFLLLLATKVGWHRSNLNYLAQRTVVEYDSVIPDLTQLDVLLGSGGRCGGGFTVFTPAHWQYRGPERCRGHGPGLNLYGVFRPFVLVSQ